MGHPICLRRYIILMNHVVVAYLITGTEITSNNIRKKNRANRNIRIIFRIKIQIWNTWFSTSDPLSRNKSQDLLRSIIFPNGHQWYLTRNYWSTLHNNMRSSRPIFHWFVQCGQEKSIVTCLLSPTKSTPSEFSSSSVFTLFRQLTEKKVSFNLS